MSQEWDEVLHEVRLMFERLEAFGDDLMAAAASGKLTGDQHEFVGKFTAATDAALLCCRKLYAEAMAEKTEEEETKE